MTIDAMFVAMWSLVMGHLAHWLGSNIKPVRFSVVPVYVLGSILCVHTGWTLGPAFLLVAIPGYVIGVCFESAWVDAFFIIAVALVDRIIHGPLTF